MRMRKGSEIDYDVNNVLLSEDNQVLLIGYRVKTTKEGLKVTDTDDLLFKEVLKRSMFDDLNMEDDDWFSRSQLPTKVREITDKKYQDHIMRGN